MMSERTVGLGYRVRSGGMVATFLAAFFFWMPAEAQVDQQFAARAEIRIQTLERQIQELRGQIETLSFQNRQLTDRLERALNDIEFRLSTLEGTDSLPQSGAVSAPQPAAQQPSTDTTQNLGTLTVTETPTGQTSVASATPATNDPNQAYNDAFNLLSQQDFPGAETALRRFVATFPQHPLAGNAQYWLGETFYVRGLFQDAAGAFAASLSNYPQGAKAVDSLLKLGMTLAAMGQTQDACITFSEIGNQFPSAPLVITRRAEQERDRLGCG